MKTYISKKGLHPLAVGLLQLNIQRKVDSDQVTDLHNIGILYF